MFDMYLFYLFLQCNEAKEKEKKEGETKLSFKLISHDERFNVRRRAVPPSRAHCM